MTRWKWKCDGPGFRSTLVPMITFTSSAESRVPLWFQTPPSKSWENDAPESPNPQKGRRRASETASHVSATQRWYCDVMAFSDKLKAMLQEAEDEGLPKPSQTAIENAKYLFGELQRHFDCVFVIDVIEDGDIAISPLENSENGAVLIECDQHGRVLCLVSLPGNSRRAMYHQTDGLADGFIREALEDLGVRNRRWV